MYLKYMIWRPHDGMLWRGCQDAGREILVGRTRRHRRRLLLRALGVESIFGSMKDATAHLTPARLAKLEALVRRPGPKRKASVSVSGPLLDATDQIAGEARRSAFIERALRRYLRRVLRRQRDARELALLNANAERLNAEAAAALAQQAALDDE